MNDLPEKNQEHVTQSVETSETGTVRRRPIGRPVVVGTSKSKPVIVKAKDSALVKVSLPKQDGGFVALPALQGRPKFEDCHHRRTIYLENGLDSKVQQICKTHSVYRSMSLLIQAALSEFFQAKKL